jgi:Flp pilus assembly protein TadG
MTRRKRQTGQALIETALVLSSLILMVVGIMDFGQFLFFHEALTDRVRVGARYAAVNPYDVTAIQNMVVYNSATAPAEATSGLFGLRTSYVTVTPTPSTGTPTYVQVKISGFPIQLLSPFLAKTYTHHPIIATRKTENIAAAGAKN